MNGTTNFMLTKMESGADYGEVLAEAQALGFAEGACSQCWVWGVGVEEWMAWEMWMWIDG
jgi:hypothetical protein